MNKIGTREEVFKGLADKTSGGLTKNDIICKIIGGKTLYISSKKSKIMKDILKKTKTNNGKNTILNQEKSTSNMPLTKKNVYFSLNQNKVVSYNYEELAGINLDQLRKEMDEEESSESKEFTIETLDDSELDQELNNLV